MFSFGERSDNKESVRDIPSSFLALLRVFVFFFVFVVFCVFVIWSGWSEKEKEEVVLPTCQQWRIGEAGGERQKEKKKLESWVGQLEFTNTMQLQNTPGIKCAINSMHASIDQVQSAVKT